MRRLIILISAFIPLVANAQALPFIGAEYSPAASAKGGISSVETTSIAYASFSNTAVVPFSDQKGDFAAGYTLWQPTLSKVNVISAAGAYNIKNKFGVAGGFSYGMHPGYEAFDEAGTSKGMFKPSDFMLNLGFSWRFIDWLALGINMEYASQKLAESHNYGAVSTDIFLMTKVNGFKGALGLSNLGTKVTAANGDKFSLPSSFTAGLGYDCIFAEKHKLDVNAELNYYFYKAFSAALGAGYTFNEMISVKAGYKYGGKSIIPSYASVGAGFRFAGVTLDFAYLMGGASSPMKNTLSIGLGYRF